MRIKKKIAQAPEKLLKIVDGGKELETSRWSTCENVSILQFKESLCKEEEKVEEEQSSTQTAVPAVQVSSARDSAEVLTLFLNDVSR